MTILRGLIVALVLLPWPQTPAPLPPCARPAVLVRVIDGDTWVLDVDLEYDVHVHATIREEGLYAPELGTPEGVTAKAEAVRRFDECRGRIAVQSTGHRSFIRFVGRTYLCGQRFRERGPR